MKMHRKIIIGVAGVTLIAGALLSTGDQECRITSQDARMISETEMRVVGMSNCESGAITIDVMGEDHVIELRRGLFGATVTLDGEKVVSVQDARG